jgi:hypothetical protein
MSAAINVHSVLVATSCMVHCTTALGASCRTCSCCIHNGSSGLWLAVCLLSMSGTQLHCFSWLPCTNTFCEPAVRLQVSQQESPSLVSRSASMQCLSQQCRRQACQLPTSGCCQTPQQLLLCREGTFGQQHWQQHMQLAAVMAAVLAAQVVPATGQLLGQQLELQWAQWWDCCCCSVQYGFGATGGGDVRSSSSSSRQGRYTSSQCHPRVGLGRLQTAGTLACTAGASSYMQACQLAVTRVLMGSRGTCITAK